MIDVSSDWRPRTDGLLEAHPKVLVEACSPNNLLAWSRSKPKGFQPNQLHSPHFPAFPHLSRILFRSLSFVIAADRPRICVFLASAEVCF